MRLVFMGTPQFAAVSLQALLESSHRLVGVVTRPDRPRGRGRKMAFSAVKEVALEHGLPLLQPRDLKDPEFLAALAGWEPELIVVVAFGRLLPSEVLNLPSRGCVNLHASLLPRYRGAAPIQRVIMEGERETGVTTMYMTEELDAGDIILQEKVEIPPEMTAGELHDELAVVGARLLVRTVELIAAGRAPRFPQEEAKATYAPPLKPEEEEIKWQEKAERIVNLIRGMNPLPGAFTWREGRRLKIFGARVLEDGEGVPVNGRPGEVVAVRPREGFVVQAGRGRVLVTAVQPPGKRIMTAEEYLRGHPLKVGERLGCE
ncbi:MAG TPA: methionyl-tRNA formyltransferase [Peptococcaceae bacterium]|nr:methionyl-tRNA formyltransferase [Peptococcaceae bacterium]